MHALLYDDPFNDTPRYEFRVLQEKEPKLLPEWKCALPWYCSDCRLELRSFPEYEVGMCEECFKWHWHLSEPSDDPYDEPDYGGAFDGFTVTSDADPGL